MELHLEELALARCLADAECFEPLTREQLNSILEHGRRLHRWFKQHGAIHRAINVTLLVVLLAADWYLLMQLPRTLLGAATAGAVRWLFVALSVGAVHSWLIYSIV